MLNIKKLFTAFLDLKPDMNFVDTFEISIPLPLRELYEIKELYNQTKPNNQLFDTQDSLTNISKIDFSSNFFIFYWKIKEIGFAKQNLAMTIQK